MITKVFEIRDRGTMVPVLAVKIDSADSEEPVAYLLRHVGYAPHRPCVLMASLAGGRRAEYDPYNWSDRTYAAAHHYIVEHFDDLEDGAVVDVEFLLGESAAPKVSERETAVAS